MRFLGKLILLLLLMAAAAAVWFWLGISLPYQDFPAGGVIVDLPHGASSRTIGRLLERNGVVRSAVAFEIYARRHPTRKLQAGEYFFDHAISGHDVFWQIANGNVYVLPFTVREGETIFDIAHDLEAAKFMSADDFLVAVRNPAAIRDLAPGAATLEGFLFPATYLLPHHPVPAEVTGEMVRKFREEWTGLNAESGSPAPSGAQQLADVVSIVTLASLVERETPNSAERPLVAGVFENRLRFHMPLQCDPTVIYVLQQSGSYNGSLTGLDLRVDSPYNTYTHVGLPPGPIGNPGEQSIRAALSPARTDFLYFVANTQGGHFFSKTLAEHNRNVTKYRRLLAAQSTASSVPSAKHPRGSTP